jgi:hypothetical protein
MKARTLLVVSLLLAGLAFAAREKWVNVPAATLKGEPALAQGAGDAVFIWSSPRGLHLRWRAGQAPRLFTGKIDTDGKVQEVVRIDQQGGGWARTHGEHRVLFSATVRAGDLDGIDVLTSSGRVDLVLDMDEQAPPVEMIFLGKEGAHPSALPLRLRLR